MPRGYTRFGENVEKTFQSIEINSREELQKIADEEDREINWKLWNTLVQKTKQDISTALKKHKNPQYINKVFVFSIKKQKVIKIFNNPQDCSNFYGIAAETITRYMREHRIYYKLGVEFRKG